MFAASLKSAPNLAGVSSNNSLRSLASSGSEPDERKNDVISKTINTDDDVITSQVSGVMHFLRPPSHDKVALILMPPSFTYYVSGFCHLTVLRGKIMLNGFSVKAQSAKRTIYAPSWTPALPLETAAPKMEADGSRKSSGGKHSLQKALKKINMLETYREVLVSLDEGILLTNTTWILVEGIPEVEQEWMVAAETKDLFKENLYLVAS